MKEAAAEPRSQTTLSHHPSSNSQGFTCCPQPVLAPLPSEEPIPKVTEEAFEGVGDIIHMVLALLQTDTAGIPAQHLQQAGGLGILPTLAVDALRCQPCIRTGGDEALSMRDKDFSQLPHIHWLPIKH